MRYLPIVISLAWLAVAGCVTPKEYKYVKQPKDVVEPDLLPDIEDTGADVTPEDVPDVDCKPVCKGKQCGDDGCGGSCGSCGANGLCEKGKCVCPSPHEPCFGLCCDLDLVCNVDTGTCCNFSCFDKECGKVCGKSCGTCPDNKQCNLEGKCACAKPLCGVVCCQTTEVCIEGICCKPSCSGKQCGPDGCGGSCGECGDTGNPCTQETCVTGKCTEKPFEGTCDDGDPCTNKDQCIGGTCTGSEPECGDDNPCTADSCDPETGDCKHDSGPLDGANCDDGNPCTGSDKCAGGVCAGTLLPPDQLAELECTCKVDKDCEPLDDDDVCNGVLACKIEEGNAFGLCVIPAESLPVCDDDNPCTDDGCDKKLGCVHPDDDTNDCDDGDPCNGANACEAGVCVAKPAPDCDDSNPCTDDVCTPNVGCEHTPNDANSCGDDDPCNGTESCQSGTCFATQPLDCDDSNPCTDDVCTPNVGCEHTPNDANPCDDADACNGAETCQDGTCTAGQPPVCDDANPCTDDACTPGVGCEHVDKDCADADPCTVDSCDPVLGCGHVYAGEGAPCGEGKTCTAGQCG